MNINTNCNKQFHLKNYKIFRKQQKIYMTFGLVISSNTRQKKPTYRIINYLKHWLLQLYTFTLWRTLLERTKNKLLNEPLTTQPCQATEKRKHLLESSYKQGTNKFPPTRILERSKGDGRLQFRGPTNLPGSSSLESISAEWCVCPQEGSQFRMTGKTRN